ncbi:MAG: Rrf2 family transcriptional regulator [bacterium]|nr:Rrf2 family transcriptional regulator [bacterium]
MNTVCAKPQGTRMRSGALHLTQKVDYALYLLTCLAQYSDGQHSSIATIAKKSHLSFSFLQKVANILKRAGLIHSHRGKDGGYSLAHKPSDIVLRDVIEALEGPITVMACAGEAKHDCPRKSFCSIRSGFQKMNDEIHVAYLSKTLTDFL